jgi:hypothetical protein
MGCPSHLVAVPGEVYLADRFDQLLSKTSNGARVVKIDISGSMGFAVVR